MVDLSTKYLGLNLINPIIIGSSGLTDTVEKIKKLEQKGAGAVVLKSIFEEEITLEYNQILKEAEELGYHNENLDYFDVKIKQQNIEKYLKLISDAKKAISIPLIASINCISSHEWTYIAKKIQNAGADAIELNMYILPTSLESNNSEIEQKYFEITKKVIAEITIPVSVKISSYFTNLPYITNKFAEIGVSGLVFFNKFYNIDIDVDNQNITTANILSNPTENSSALRWISMLSNKIKCDFAATTGIHDGKSVVKQILVGASAVEMVSTFYKNGTNYIKVVLNEITEWMEKNNYGSIKDFKGKMSQSKSSNPAIYERVQFMKYFANYQE